MSKLRKQLGFGHIGVLAVVVILALVGFSGWLVYDRQNKSKTSDSTNKAEGTTTNNQKTTDSSLTTTTVKSLESGDKTSVTVKHPTNWEVSNKSEDIDGSGTIATRAYIKSDKGNYLHISNTSGLGGDCEDDTLTYTLIKRISTQSSNYFFAEYTREGGATRYLSLENSTSSPSWSKMKEGDTNTNQCGMPQYTFAGGLYVAITKTATRSLSSSVPYSELKEDPEFLTMLQSLKVSE